MKLIPPPRYLALSVFVCASIFFATLLRATAASPPIIGPTPAPSSSPAPLLLNPLGQRFGDWIWNEIIVPLGKNAGDKIIAAISAGALAVAGLTWQYARKRARSVFFDFPRRTRERGHLILLLGETASGKTTLIKQAFSYSTRLTGAPNPRRPTDDIGVYTVLHETKTEHSSEAYRYDIVDYRGSDPGQIADQWDFVVRDLKFKEVTAVILVVDIFGASDNQKEHENRNRDEVKRLVAYWKGCLGTLSGTIGDRPELAALFVNKLDLLTNVPMRSIVEGSGSRIPVIRRELAPLEQVLKTIFSVEVDVIAGSLLYGIGVNDLLAKLRDVSPEFPK
jgi:hypothetical protein